MTQPTLGLGAERPTALAPSASASPISLRSSLNPEPLLELFILALLLFRQSRLLRLVLLLVGDDLRVGPVGRVELDIHRRRRGHGAKVGVDEEFDDDDPGREQRQRGADPLLAPAGPKARHQVAQGCARAGGTGKPRHIGKIGRSRVPRHPPYPSSWKRSVITIVEDTA